MKASFQLLSSADGQLIPTDRGTVSTTVFFAGMFPSWPNKARVPGFVLDVGTRLALDHINNDSSILPGYTLDMVTGDSKVRYMYCFDWFASNLHHRLVFTLTPGFCS